MHHSQGDGQPLFHAEGILRKELFVLIGQAHQFQRIPDGVPVGNAPQRGKNAQIFGGRQIGIKTGRLDQASDPGQQHFFMPRQRGSP